jgi:hypothetical protein
MAFSYRWTSGALLAFIPVAAVVKQLSPRSWYAPPAPNVGTWDPCFLWEQIPQSVRIASLWFFAALVVVSVQGLRNRAAPRWLAAGALPALAVAEHERYRFLNCYGRVDKALFAGYTALIVVMFLHHVVQRPPVSGRRRPWPYSPRSG